jgi:hypothetical protein
LPETSVSKTSQSASLVHCAARGGRELGPVGADAGVVVDAFGDADVLVGVDAHAIQTIETKGRATVHTLTSDLRLKGTEYLPCDVMVCIEASGSRVSMATRN